MAEYPKRKSPRDFFLMRWVTLYLWLKREKLPLTNSSLDDAQLDRALAFLHGGTQSVAVEDSPSLYPKHLAAMPTRCPNLRELTVSRCNYRDEFVPRSACNGAIFRSPSLMESG